MSTILTPTQRWPTKVNVDHTTARAALLHVRQRSIDESELDTDIPPVLYRSRKRRLPSMPRQPLLQLGRPRRAWGTLMGTDGSECPTGRKGDTTPRSEQFIETGTRNRDTAGHRSVGAGGAGHCRG